MRATLLCSVIAVFGVTPAFAAPALESKVVDLTASKGSASFRSAVLTTLERSYLVDLERCYLREPRVRAYVAVTRELVFEIRLDGEVAMVSSSFAKRAQPCVADAVKHWKLGVARGRFALPMVVVFTTHVDIGPAHAADNNTSADMLIGEPVDAVDMRPTRPGADLAAQIDAINKQQGSAPVGGAISARPVRITVVDRQALDASTLTADVVASKLQVAYLGGLRRCYVTRLATTPSLKGRVTLTLPVDETGRVVRPTARGFDTEIDRCLADAMTSWRFPVPRDADGKPTSARFTLGVALATD